MKKTIVSIAWFFAFVVVIMLFINTIGYFLVVKAWGGGDTHGNRYELSFNDYCRYLSDIGRDR